MSKANKEAQKERHQKLFEGQYHTRIGKFWFHFRRFSKALWRRVRPSRKGLSHFMHPLDHLPAPKRLYTQLTLWSLGLLVLTSVNITSAAYQGGEGWALSTPTITSLWMLENLISPMMKVI